MDRREAIDVLTGLYRLPVENGADKFASEINKALDLAIEALQEPKSEQYKKGFEDAKRAFLIEIALHDCTNGEVPYFTGKGVQEILNILPPVTPTVSEDCISRQKAIETCDKVYPKVDRQDIKAVIQATPSITPTERTGEWAVAYLDHESVGVRPRTLYCSECNWLTSFPSAWCPNCGAKMKGGTE